MSYFTKPQEILAALVTAGVEVIRARDPKFAAGLDVPPPSVDDIPFVAAPTQRDHRGFLYRVARKVYRTLLHIGPFQSILRKLRSRLLPAR